MAAHHYVFVQAVAWISRRFWLGTCALVGARSCKILDANLPICSFPMCILIQLHITQKSDGEGLTCTCTRLPVWAFINQSGATYTDYRPPTKYPDAHERVCEANHDKCDIPTSPRQLRDPGATSLIKLHYIVALLHYWRRLVFPSARGVK